MKLQGCSFKNEEVAAVQYFPATKDSEGKIISAAHFHVVLKSGAVLDVVAGGQIYNRVEAELFPAEN